jgi:hypothetical protein
MNGTRSKLRGGWRLCASPLVGLGLLTGMIPAGIALANGGNATITRFHSVASVGISSVQTSSCPGPNGPDAVTFIKGQGPINSDDPRLVGTFHVDAVILVNAQGEGVSRDNWQITDSATGTLKASGTAYGVQHGSNPIKALSIGQLADGSRTMANALVTLPAPGSQNPITIEYGGSGSPLEDDAVVVGPACARLVFADQGGQD